MCTKGDLTSATCHWAPDKKVKHELRYHQATPYLCYSIPFHGALAPPCSQQPRGFPEVLCMFSTQRVKYVDLYDGKNLKLKGKVLPVPKLDLYRWKVVNAGQENRSWMTSGLLPYLMLKSSLQLIPDLYKTGVGMGQQNSRVWEGILCWHCIPVTGGQFSGTGILLFSLFVFCLCVWFQSFY